MSGKSGPGNLKNLRKVKPGYDQEFTLPKGTSAAPIKQVATRAKTPSGDLVFKGGKGSIWSKVKHKDAKKLILDPAKKATKKANKIPFLAKAGVATGIGIGTVSHIRDKKKGKYEQGNKNNKRPVNKKKLDSESPS